MCGRYSLITPTGDLSEHLLVSDVPEMPARYNIAPTQPVLIVRAGPPDRPGREAALVRWGLVPSWAKELKIGARLINARAESAAVKPAFRAAFKRRRCLVPADGFYEWQRRAGGKQPFYVRLRGGGPLAFAGLWERWQAPEGDVLDSCTILTTTANALCEAIHDRMPVILDPAAYEHWLKAPEAEAPALQSLLRPFPAERLEAAPVSRYVNSPRNEGPACLAPPEG